MGVGPHGVTKDFEAAVCEYTGAPYCVAVSSCSMALLLAVKWHIKHGPRTPVRVDVNFGGGNVRRGGVSWIEGQYFEIEIPKRTYVSVPMSIIHAGGRPVFRDEDWKGCYQLKPLPVWDSARWFTSGMYASYAPDHLPRKWHCIDSMLCVSFHASKILGDTQGGAILHDNAEADAWFRRMRFDGRTEGVAPRDDDFREIGYHCYLSPDVSARLLLRLYSLPRHNEPLENDPYPELDKLEIFR